MSSSRGTSVTTASSSSKNKKDFHATWKNIGAANSNSKKNKMSSGPEHNVSSVPGCLCCREEIFESCPFVIDCEGYNYHPECFNCVKCGDNIGDGNYKQTKDGPVCLPCGLPQCAGCLDLIVGDMIVAQHVDGTKYSFHTQCLKCVNCSSHIHGKYKATEHGFICESCDSPSCMTCHSKIKGGSQYYLDGHTHQPQCNNCYRNNVLLNQKNGSFGVGSVANANVTKIVISPSPSRNATMVY